MHTNLKNIGSVVRARRTQNANRGSNDDKVTENNRTWGVRNWGYPWYSLCEKKWIFMEWFLWNM